MTSCEIMIDMDILNSLTTRCIFKQLFIQMIKMAYDVWSMAVEYDRS